MRMFLHLARVLAEARARAEAGRQPRPEMAQQKTPAQAEKTMRLY